MILLLQITIFAIAAFATYASVYGLGTLFASVAVPVMIAGTALEAGKYVAMSYAYQHWSAMRWIERSLMLVFLTVTMVFTSVGVFSYLGQGYQTSYSNLDASRSRISELETQRVDTVARINAIEKQITDLPANIVRGRITLIREYEKEREPLIKRRDALVYEVSSLRASTQAGETHAGPISFIAKSSGLTIERAAMYSILAFTLCLDPFALYLTALLNKLLLLRRNVAPTIDDIDTTSPTVKITDTQIDTAVSVEQTDKPEYSDSVNGKPPTKELDMPTTNINTLAAEMAAQRKANEVSQSTSPPTNVVKRSVAARKPAVTATRNVNNKKATVKSKKAKT
jgi:hypothetical protein